MTDDSAASRGRANPSAGHAPVGEARGASEAHVQVRVRLGELELGYSGVRSYYETRVDGWTHEVLQRLRAGLLTPAGETPRVAEAEGAGPATSSPGTPSASASSASSPMGAVVGAQPTSATQAGGRSGSPPQAQGTSGEPVRPAGQSEDRADERAAATRPATTGGASTGILTFDDEDDEFVPIEEDRADRATFDPTGSPRFAPFLRQVGDRARRPDQQVMAFAFFLWNHERMPSFAPADLEACFKGIGIPAPGDLGGIVDDLVDRQRFLAPDEESGGLQLTPKGVNYAKNRLVRPV